MMQVNHLFFKKIFFVFLVLLLAGGFSACKKSKSKSSKKKKKAKTEQVKNNKPKTSETGEKTEVQREKVVKEAKTFIGVKYLYGGTTRSGIDCSGLIGNAYKNIGIQLPRSSKEMAFAGDEIRKSEVKKGDLVFFDEKTGGRNISHVGMVTDVKSSSSVLFIHSTTQKGVMEDDLYSNYWSQRFIKAVKILGR